MSIKLNDAAKTAITGVINGIIDEFQENALKQLVELGEDQLDALVKAQVTAYCDALTAYAEKTDSWWVKIRNKFIASIISNSTDAIVTAVKESVEKLTTEGIDDLQKVGVEGLIEKVTGKKEEK